MKDLDLIRPHFRSFGLNITYIDNEFRDHWNCRCAFLRDEGKNTDVYLGDNFMYIKDACGVNHFKFPGIDRSDVKTPIDLVNKYINSLK